VKLKIIGPKVLARAYALPERIGSLYVPDSVRTQWDGKCLEVIAVGDEVAKRVAVGGTRGDEIFPILSHDEGLPELHLKPDDIIVLRYQFRGVWAGPEVRDAFGADCWFVSVEEFHGAFGLRCSIERVIPASSWQENEEAA
jgi:hypothetical protein